MFAVGFGVFRSFIDSFLAEVTEGSNRAGIYSIINTITCILTAIVAFISGSLYVLNPKFLYIAAIVILLSCVGMLIVFLSKKGTNLNIEKFEDSF